MKLQAFPDCASAGEVLARIHRVRLLRRPGAAFGPPPPAPALVIEPAEPVAEPVTPIAVMPPAPAHVPPPAVVLAAVFITVTSLRRDAMPRTDYGPTGPTPGIIKLIISLAARHCHVTVDEILGPRRTAPCIFPRHIAMYLAKTLTGRSLPDIGRRFNGRDHTTVLNAIYKVKARLDAGEPRTTAAVEAITAELAERQEWATLM